jgi:hypothetical protein
VISPTHASLWRRLDTPGHDACAIALGPHGCSIEGTAVFLHEGMPARLAYSLLCDTQWKTRSGAVRGFVGDRAIDVRVERSEAGLWRLDGETVSGLEACEHLDFGFTPATNFPHFRALRLRVGNAADLPVAWLDVPPAPLRVLPQRYERRTDTAYWYEAPTIPYAALLELAPSGMMRNYPELWELEE